MIPRLYAAAMVLCGLAGCAAQQQREAVQSYSACLMSVYNSPQTAPLLIHIPFNSNDATLPQLDNQSFVTDTEISSLEAIYPQLKFCENSFLHQLANVAPTFTPIFAANYRGTDDDVVALIQHKMTWGDFTRRRRDRDVVTGEAIAAEDQKLAAEGQARTAAALQGLAILSNQAKPSSLPAGAYRLPSGGITCIQEGVTTQCQ